jgi:hypothetical protein
LILEARGRIVFGESLIVQIAGFLEFGEHGVHILRALRAAAQLFPKLTGGMRASAQSAECNV